MLIEILLRVTGYVGDIDRQRMTFSQYMGDVEKDSWVFDLKEEQGNKNSMRINESTIAVKKEPGTIRILFIGDSGTVGTGVESGSEVGGHQRRRLRNDDNRRVSFIEGQVTHIKTRYHNSWPFHGQRH